MKPALHISNLCKVYKGGTEAIRNINLEVQDGDFFALLGENGAGKSTTLGIVCSLVNKTSGNVSIFGYDINAQPSLAKRQIGIVPQEFNCNIFERVKDILYQQAGYYGMSYGLMRERGEKYMKKLGLWEKRKEQSRNLSGGMKRRLMIARALMHEPRLLILDEPTAGVDVDIRHSMWEFLTELNQQGTTIILTTHYLEEAEHLCRNVAIIHKGEILVNSSMYELLHQLKEQTYIVESTHDLPNDIKGDFYQTQKIKDNVLEVHLDRSYKLNDLFKDLDSKGIDISSIDLKDNRLERTFIELTK